MHLDTLLSLQLAVAWAGERGRLGWWRTSLLDPYGGLDLFETDLAFSQPAWAAWTAVREAARRVDSRARSQHRDPSQLNSLFHWGITIDEQLEDRLRELREKGDDPRQLLPVLAQALGDDELDPEDWERTGFDALLADLPRSPSRQTTLGRELRGAHDKPDPRARQLAAELLPLTPSYTLTYVDGLL